MVGRDHSRASSAFGKGWRRPAVSARPAGSTRKRQAWTAEDMAAPIVSSGYRQTGLSVTTLYLIISQTMLAISPINPLTAVAMKKRSMGAMMPPRRPNSRARRRFHLWGLDRKRGAFTANARPIGDLARCSVGDPNQAVARHERLESRPSLSPKRAARQKYR